MINKLLKIVKNYKNMIQIDENIGILRKNYNMIVFKNTKEIKYRTLI
jgi:hypothetical protein